MTAAKKVARKFKDSDLIGAKLGENLVAGLLSAAFPGAIVSRDGVDGEADRMVRLPEGASALRELLNPSGDADEVSGLPTDRPHTPLGPPITRPDRTPRPARTTRSRSHHSVPLSPLRTHTCHSARLHNHHRCR